VKVLAKPGDNYIFSGTVTNLNMRTSTLFIDNTTDDQNYEVHFSRDAVNNFQGLRVGAQVTARATFDGKQYTASNVHVEKPQPNQPEQSPAPNQPDQPQAPGQQSEVH
jgi:cold shock CspA family protein